MNYTLDDPAKGYAALDPNHTHHFLVDDGKNWKTTIFDNFVRNHTKNVAVKIFMAKTIKTLSVLETSVSLEQV